MPRARTRPCRVRRFSLTRALKPFSLEGSLRVEFRGQVTGVPGGRGTRGTHLMPRTKPGPKQPPSPPANGPAGDVLTLSEAAGYLRLPEADVLRLVHEQGLPARHVGLEWRFLLSALREWLGRSIPSRSNKEAWMELAGVWRDDPDFDDLLRQMRLKDRKDQA